MKFLFGLMLFSLIGLLAVNWFINRLRGMRGEPVPEQKGPRTITLVCIFLIAIYALLIIWRLHAQGLGALHGG